jgi:hypothetical protein
MFRITVVLPPKIFVYVDMISRAAVRKMFPVFCFLLPTSWTRENFTKLHKKIVEGIAVFQYSHSIVEGLIPPLNKSMNSHPLKLSFSLQPFTHGMLQCLHFVKCQGDT